MIHSWEFEALNTLTRRFFAKVGHLGTELQLCNCQGAFKQEKDFGQLPYSPSSSYYIFPQWHWFP